MIRAVIFDCFGVVIADGLEAVILRREKTDPTIKEFVSETIQRTNRGLLHPDESRQIIGKRLGITADDWRSEISAEEIRNPDVINLIHKLKKKYKTAMLSNIGKDSLRHRFSADELEELFDVVVASAEVGMAKPDPEIYELTAGKLSVEVSECVFIDDRQPYVDGAKAVGMQAILYQDFPQFKRDLDKILADAES